MSKWKIKVRRRSLAVAVVIMIFLAAGVLAALALLWP